KLPREAIDDGRSREETHLVGGEVVEHFGSEIFGDQAIVAGKGDSSEVARAACLESERRQIQADGPALRPFNEKVEFTVSQAHAGILQEPSCLLVVQREFVDADLHDVASRSEPWHRQWWIDARRDRESSAGREMERKLGDGVATSHIPKRLDV